MPHVDKGPIQTIDAPPHQPLAPPLPFAVELRPFGTNRLRYAKMKPHGVGEFMTDDEVDLWMYHLAVVAGLEKELAGVLSQATQAKPSGGGNNAGKVPKV